MPRGRTNTTYSAASGWKGRKTEPNFYKCGDEVEGETDLHFVRRSSLAASPLL